MKFKQIYRDDPDDFKAPPGKFRVILYDAYTFKHYFIDDYKELPMANKRAEEVSNDGAGFYHTTVYDANGTEMASYGNY